MTSILDAAKKPIHQLADEIAHPLMNGRDPWTAAELTAALRALYSSAFAAGEAAALRAMFDAVERDPAAIEAMAYGMAEDDPVAALAALRALKAHVLGE
jgi:hypothetical protein